MSKQREIRVFISSTFRDMEADRNELVKQVFPKLRRLCEERGVVWGEVDLRWGITDEQSAEGEVLPICLEEIERCRPYFIGILGERYGWTPDSIDADLLARQPWLKKHKKKSVTELEIIHGVLDNPEMAKRAYFYFRDPAYVEGKSNDFSEELDSDDAKKLEELKQTIRDKHLPVHENYENPENLAEYVLADITAAINQEFPEDETLEPLDRETLEHDAVAQQLAQVYIERPGYFDKLNAHVAGDGPPLVVLGESGSGKSALLANWVMHYREANPDTPVLLHFIGGTPHSADWQQMLRRVMGELKRRFDIADDIPTDAQGLRDALPVFLASAAAQGKCVLILDALNQLDDRDAAPDLGWLPQFIPENIRLIVTTLKGRPLDALEKRDWPTMTVHLMDVNERKALITKYLKDKYAKELSDARVNRIAADNETANPLYLKAILEEVRLFGDHDRLDERIDYYLATNTIPKLFACILGRYELDYERNRPHLVRDVMRSLWAARRGLSEVELLQLLGGDGDPLPQAHWSPLSLASNQAIVNRSGLLNFAHDYLRQAVETVYLTERSVRTEVHMFLAKYFELETTLGDRTLDELPWQLQQAENWPTLRELLTKRLVFLRLRFQEKWKLDLHQYWRDLRPHFDPISDYNAMCFSALEEELSISITYGTIAHTATFYEELGEFDAAGPWRIRSLKLVEILLQSPQPEIAVDALANLAHWLDERGNYEASEPLYRRAFEMTCASHGPLHPNTLRAANNHAFGLERLGKDTEAENIYRQILKDKTMVLGENHESTLTSTNNLGMLLINRGDYASAEPFLQRAYQGRESVLGPNHLETLKSLDNLAVALLQQMKVSEAREALQIALKGYQSTVGESHPDALICLQNCAYLCLIQLQYSEAEDLFRRSFEGTFAILGLDHPRSTAYLKAWEDCRELMAKLERL